MTLRTEILQSIDDPTNAYVVLIAGGILLISEFLRPGRVVPGVGGAVLFTVAFTLSYSGSGVLPVPCCWFCLCLSPSAAYVRNPTFLTWPAR